jgi:hypothetical protein
LRPGAVSSGRAAPRPRAGSGPLLRHRSWPLTRPRAVPRAPGPCCPGSAGPAVCLPSIAGLSRSTRALGRYPGCSPARVRGIAGAYRRRARPSPVAAGRTLTLTLGRIAGRGSRVCIVGSARAMSVLPTCAHAVRVNPRRPTGRPESQRGGARGLPSCTRLTRGPSSVRQARVLTGRSPVTTLLEIQNI